MPKLNQQTKAEWIQSVQNIFFRGSLRDEQRGCVKSYLAETVSLEESQFFFAQLLLKCYDQEIYPDWYPGLSDACKPFAGDAKGPLSFDQLRHYVHNVKLDAYFKGRVVQNLSVFSSRPNPVTRGQRQKPGSSLARDASNLGCVSLLAQKKPVDALKNNSEYASKPMESRRGVLQPINR